jgi:hypothetical protein
MGQRDGGPGDTLPLAVDQERAIFLMLSSARGSNCPWANELSNKMENRVKLLQVSPCSRYPRVLVRRASLGAIEKEAVTPLHREPYFADFVVGSCGSGGAIISAMTISLDVCHFAPCPVLRRAHNSSLSHRRLALCPLPVMIVNVDAAEKVP